MGAQPSSDRGADVERRLRAAGCVFAEDEARLLVGATGTAHELADLVTRRVAGEPLEHLLGWAAFHGGHITVEPGVFVPRRRTELLVDRAAKVTRPGAVVVDLCCGSGAVGAALAASVGPIELHAADLDPAAVRCARRNLGACGGHAHQGDLYRALPADLRGRVDVLVVNAPYVPTGELALLPPEAREHEPRVALDGGADGLDVNRRVVAGSPHWLAPRGHLLVEVSRLQAAEVVATLRRANLEPSTVSDDESGTTVVVGRAPT